MLAWLRKLAFLFFAALWMLPAHADPLVLFLISAAREIVTAAARERAPPAEPIDSAAGAYPGTAVRPEHLRRIVDESFVYLASHQRAEVFDRLHSMLLDPKLGGSRAALIDYFVHQALAVRAAQSRLANLSDADKRELASRFSSEIAGLAQDERVRLLELLQRRLLPVPADLNQMLLAELLGEG